MNTKILKNKMVQLKAAQHTDSVCDIASLRRRLHKEWLVFY